MEPLAREREGEQSLSMASMAAESLVGINNVNALTTVEDVHVGRERFREGFRIRVVFKKLIEVAQFRQFFVIDCFWIWTLFLFRSKEDVEKYLHQHLGREIDQFCHLTDPRSQLWIS
jgi:hypothetical protein